MLWFAFAALALLATVVLLRPLLSAAPRVEGGDDAEVYASQLEEVDADLARGAISAADAEAARTEIARRLLRAHRSGRKGPRMRRRDWVTAAIVGMFVPVFTVGAYMAIGSPDYGDQPLAARNAPMSDDELRNLLARAEERLAENPDDPQGWAAVAPVYQSLGRYRDAATAWGRVNEIAGEDPDRLIAQAENLVLAARGEVRAEARDLFARAYELAPDNVTPAIFLAVAARQRGDFEEASERWRTLIRNSEGDEVWLEIAATEFSLMSGASGRESANLSPPGTPGSEVAPPRTPGAEVTPPAAGAPATPGPTGEEVAAAAAMSPEAREAMVEGMVTGLARRLEEGGGSAQEWLRLVRSYKVLGREDDAIDALNMALSRLPETDHAVLTEAADVRELLSREQ